MKDAVLIIATILGTTLTIADANASDWQTRRLLAPSGSQ